MQFYLEHGSNFLVQFPSVVLSMKVSMIFLQHTHQSVKHKAKNHYMYTYIFFKPYTLYFDSVKEQACDRGFTSVLRDAKSLRIKFQQ